MRRTYVARFGWLALVLLSTLCWCPRAGAQSMAAPLPEVWLREHAWAPARVTDPALVGSIPDECLRYRRKLHREVLDALEDGKLNDRGKAEACRLLSVLRAYDRRSMAALVALYDLKAEPPEGEYYNSPTKIDWFDRVPARYALWLVGPPALEPLFTAPLPGSLEGQRRIAESLAVAAGPAAEALLGERAPELLPLTQDNWGRRAYRNISSGWYYGMRRKPAAGPLGDLVESLDSDDPAVRVMYAGDLMRRQRAAEQWLAEALAQGDRNSAGWSLRKDFGGAGGPDYDRDFVTQWPEGQRPPVRLTEQARFECIQMLAELRSLNGGLIGLLHEYLKFMPESWPHPVPPAGFALARVGPQALQPLNYPRQDRDSSAEWLANKDWAAQLTPEQRTELERRIPASRQVELDTIGLMFGRYAADALWTDIKATGWDVTEEKVGVPYLREHYKDAPAIWELIPDEPPPAD